MIPFMTEAESVSSGFILAALLLATVVTVVAWQTFHTARKTKQAWRAFATAHGWSYTEIAREIEVLGVHHGAQVSLVTETQGRTKGSPFRTVLRVDLSDALPSGLHLETKHLIDKVLKLAGKRDEEVGDRELDSALYLKDLTPQVRAFLVAPQVRDHLLRASKGSMRLVIIGGLLEAEHPGVPDTTVELEKHVAPTLALVEALQTAAGEAAVPETHTTQRD